MPRVPRQPAVLLIALASCGARSDLGTVPPAAAAWVAIEAGYAHACAIASDGTVACWGEEPYLPTLASGETLRTAAGPDVVSASVYMDCAVRPEGSLGCWGRVRSGRDDPLGRVFDLPSIEGAARVELTLSRGCVVDRRGALSCWDLWRSLSGEVAYPLVTELRAIVRVATGVEDLVLSDEGYVCARTAAGDSAWDLREGALEPTDPWASECRSDRLVGGPVRGCEARHGAVRCWDAERATGEASYAASDVVELGMGRFVCWRRRGGEVGCAGRIVCEEEACAAEWTSGTVPIELPGPASDLAVGNAHACALVSGEIWCWGENEAGQLGDGTRTRSLAPVRAVVGSVLPTRGDGIDGDGRTAPGTVVHAARIADSRERR